MWMSAGRANRGIEDSFFDDGPGAITLARRLLYLRVFILFRARSRAEQQKPNSLAAGGGGWRAGPCSPSPVAQWAWA